MPVTTSEHEWEIPTLGGDSGEWGNILNDFFDERLDEEVPLYGPKSDRPSASSSAPKLYYATDENILYYNNGSSWADGVGFGDSVNNRVSEKTYLSDVDITGLNGADILNANVSKVLVTDGTGNLTLEDKGTGGDGSSSGPVLHYGPGTVQYGIDSDGNATSMSNEEIDRISLNTNEILDVERVLFEEKGGGSANSNATLEVFDLDDATVLASADLNDPTFSGSASISGTTIAIRMSLTSNLAPIEATGKVYAEISE